MNEIYEWLLFNIEGMSNDYYSVISMLPYDEYIKSVTINNLGYLHSSEDILLSFNNELISELLNFYRRDHAKNKVH